MTPSDPATAANPSARGDQITIDDIFRHHAARHPNALALADAANRETFTDGEPRRLTYAEADRIVTNIATRLRQMGLPVGAIIGVQLPNVVDNILAMLGVLRAGMIVATLPLLCRRAEAVGALNRIGAKALITCGRIGAFNQVQSVMAVAAEVFSVRYVCGFGRHLPDGVVSFDDLITAKPAEPTASFARARANGAAAHVAAITFDVVEGGFVPVARNHAELLAGGMAVLLESSLAQDTNILSTIIPSSFAGICLTLLPWLMCGGTLVLHHPFDPACLVRQGREERCGTLILPGPVAFCLASTSAFTADGPRSIIAAWRSPEGLAASPLWHEAGITLVDVSIFGEIALATARRGTGGESKPLPSGALMVPPGSTAGIVVAQFACTGAGTLAARGAMVPRRSFPPGIDRSGLPHFKIRPDGMVDSRYPCRVDSVSNALIVTGPPSGVVGVGGYRFALDDLRNVVGRIDGAATLAVQPDPIVGQRLIGNATDQKTMRAALNAVGMNPIVAAAFGERKDGEAPQS